MCVCVHVVPSVSSGGGSVQRPLSSLIPVVDVGPVNQQELTGQQRPLQVAQRVQNLSLTRYLTVFGKQISGSLAAW